MAGWCEDRIIHVGGHHGSPPCSPTHSTTHHKLHMKKESRRHSHHKYYAHNIHTTDASQKNGWGKHGGEYLRGSEYPCYQSSLLRGVPDSKYVLEQGHVRLWLPNSPQSDKRWANRHSRVCYQQCVLAHTLVWVWGRAQFFALDQQRADTPISTTRCPLDTSLAALESP